MMDSLAGDSFNMESDASSEETEKILQEASAVAEQQVGEKFPSVPYSTGLASETSTSTFE
jgi:division protein CdvB (Snf7/Vps24/ESCRT-III family)